MNNNEIADHFSLLSKLMDIHGANSFRAKSYSIAAYNIEKLPAEATTMDDATLFSMKGIGESTGNKIKELISTGKLAALDDILAKTPPGILDILQIKGLGPKKIAVIWSELGVESLGELEYACNENRLAALKGFGAKTQESVLQNIAYFKQNIGFHLWAEADNFATHIIRQLQKQHPENRFERTGDLRRQSETLEYVDIVTDLSPEQLTSIFRNDDNTNIEALSDSCHLVAIEGQPKMRFYSSSGEKFFHTLFKTTGSETFIESFSASYSIPDAPESEEAIFVQNKLPVIPAMLRESGDILTNPNTPDIITNLIQPSDIKGIIHSHSKWSDGIHIIEQMATTARDAGLEYLVISDHSQTASYAGGLKPDEIAAQHQEVDMLNDKLAPFRIFKSIESDILGDGSLDYGDSILETFDLVIASVHSNLKMSQEKAMERVLTAIRNPYTTILGHPTGRLLLSRKGYPLDHKEVIDTCAAHNVVIEINAHPRRLDIDWRWIEYALEKGVLLSIDPDAHSTEGFKDTYYGVMVAQKGGLSKQKNLSSFSLKELEAFIAMKKQQRHK